MFKKRIFRENDPRILVCSWSHNECKKPEMEICPVRSQFKPDMTTEKYVKITSHAVSCVYLGQMLTLIQYENRCLGVLA